MCTIIFDWQLNQLIVGANRDENPTRPSEKWAKRDNSVLCPLDVRGGTWIGVNDNLFVGIVNYDLGHRKGMQSRGQLVLDALNHSFDYSLEIIRQADPKEYNGYHMVIMDKKTCVVITSDYNFDTKRFKYLRPGLHILTNLGIDLPDDAKANFIRKECESKGLTIDLLKTHGESGEYDENSVCAHDKEDLWRTVSSSFIVKENGKLSVKECVGHACSSEFVEVAV